MISSTMTSLSRSFGLTSRLHLNHLIGRTGTEPLLQRSMVSLLPDHYSSTTSHQQAQQQHRKRRQRSKERRDSGRASYRFVDRTRVQVSGGMGGKGSLSVYHMIHKYKRKPDGGNGGHGGSVIIVADPNEHSLRWTNPHVMAESGTHGSGQHRHGRNGNNTVLRVPCGVVIRRVLDYDEQWDEETKTVRKLIVEGSTLDERQDEDDEDDHEMTVYSPTTGSQWKNGPYLASNDYDSDEDSDDDEDFEHTAEYDGYLTEEATSPSINTSFTPWGEREKVVIAQLDEPGSYAVVARGGRGGIGSGKMANRHGPLSQEHMAKLATPHAGETAFLEMELKMISDVGFVGFPNAGKSSLLAAMSRATPHIAPYPFTTLNPLVGYIEYQDGFRVCAADIPGLIAGASQGKGRGHDFLRHLERTKALLYIVDAAGVDGRDPVDDFEILVDEIAAYKGGSMLDRNALIVANKVDLIDQSGYQQVEKRLRAVIDKVGLQIAGDIIGISAGVTGQGLSMLSRAIREVVIKSNATRDQETLQAAED